MDTVTWHLVVVAAVATYVVTARLAGYGAVELLDRLVGPARRERSGNHPATGHDDQYVRVLPATWPVDWARDPGMDPGH